MSCVRGQYRDQYQGRDSSPDITKSGGGGGILAISKDSGGISDICRKIK